MFGGGGWKVLRRTMVITRGTKHDMIYTTAKGDNMVVVTTQDEIKLLHNRLGHMSEKGMKIMDVIPRILKKA